MGLSPAAFRDRSRITSCLTRSTSERVVPGPPAAPRVQGCAGNIAYTLHDRRRRWSRHLWRDSGATRSAELRTTTHGAAFPIPSCRRRVHRLISTTMITASPGAMNHPGEPCRLTADIALGIGRRTAARHAATFSGIAEAGIPFLFDPGQGCQCSTVRNCGASRLGLRRPQR